MKQFKGLDFTGQDIFIGLDVHRKNWTVSIYTKDFEHKTFTQDPVPEKLVNYLRRNFPGAVYHCVYEAGFSGFWAHRQLESSGVNCIVVNPADVPTKDKQRRRKSDKVDSRKLARDLRGKNLDPIYIPSRSALEDRSLVRARRTAVKEQNRFKHRIKGLLYFYGINIPDQYKTRNGYWSNNLITWLESVTFEKQSGNTTLRYLLDELRRLRKRVTYLTLEIRKLARTAHYHSRVKLLMSIPGLGSVIAMVLLTELIDIKRFKDLNNLASYVGLIPGEASSGDKEIITNITSRGNKHIKALIIQAAWVAVRKDPALTMYFNKLTKRMKKQNAIIHIARKLLNRIRYVLKNNQQYVIAVVK